MKKKFKSQLVPYVEKMKSYVGAFDLEMQINLDKNLKLLEARTISNGDTIFWIRGFGERGIFFLRNRTARFDKRGEHYYLKNQSVEIESLEFVVKGV